MCSGVYFKPLRFTCKLPYFRSGAEGSLTPDLRREKGGTILCRSFPEFANWLQKRVFLTWHFSRTFRSFARVAALNGVGLDFR
jgi:hypothetical protein